MKIVANKSAYDARRINAVIRAVWTGVPAVAAIPVGWFDQLRVRLDETRGKRLKSEADSKARKLTIFLPALRGMEFVGLLRAEHGDDTSDVDHGGVKTHDLALEVQIALFDMLGANRPPWANNVLSGAAEKKVRRIPPHIPLRIIKPQKNPTPRDRLLKRLARIAVLEKGWQRKAKMAATKLKKLRGLRARCEKRLAEQEE